jgi:hypothetical protein
MRKLLKKQGFAPKLLVTDKLRSYASAFRRLRLTCPPEQGLRSRVDDWRGSLRYSAPRANGLPPQRRPEALVQHLLETPWASTAERRFPVRIRIGVPPGGFGQCYTEMTAWLDENCGADGWTMTPSGMCGVLNDATSIYFLDATLASAFAARWCAGSRVETDGAVFRIRDDDPAPRIGAAPHRTP